MKFSYEIQLEPKGLAQALLIAENFLSQEPCLMILGDNLFHGIGLGGQLATSGNNSSCEIFTYEVVDPFNYGVAEIDKNSKLISIEEKPKKPKSKFAVTGLYYFDERAPRFAGEISPSFRGELEITSVIQKYLNEGSVLVNKLSRGTAWLDTGNINSLHDASSYIRVLEERTGLKIGCIEEIAFKNSWIDTAGLSELALPFKGNSYGAYLSQILAENKNNGG
jgi:glucose-1-phosphate thymidylyltransferase